MDNDFYVPGKVLEAEGELVAAAKLLWGLCAPIQVKAWDAAADHIQELLKE